MANKPTGKTVSTTGKIAPEIIKKWEGKTFVRRLGLHSMLRENDGTLIQCYVEYYLTTIKDGVYVDTISAKHRITKQKDIDSLVPVFEATLKAVGPHIKLDAIAQEWLEKGMFSNIKGNGREGNLQLPDHWIKYLGINELLKDGVSVRRTFSEDYFDIYSNVIGKSADIVSKELMKGFNKIKELSKHLELIKQKK